MSKKIKLELIALREASKDGMLHAEAVVNWARSHRKSALHRQFEWNDGKAAIEYRIWQARRLIQLNVTVENGEPLLVSLSCDRPRGGGYRQISDVTKSRKLSEIMLEDALRELNRARSRYAMVRELAAVWKELDSVERKRGNTPLKKAA